MRRRALFALVAILAVSALVLAPSPSSARDPLPRGAETTIGDEPTFDTTGRRPASTVHHAGAAGDDEGWHKATTGGVGDSGTCDGDGVVCVGSSDGGYPPAMWWHMLKILMFRFGVL